MSFTKESQIRIANEICDLIDPIPGKPVPARLILTDSKIGEASEGKEGTFRVGNKGFSFIVDGLAIVGSIVSTIVQENSLRINSKNSSWLFELPEKA